MTLEQRLKSTPSGLLAWHQERSILEVTELLLEHMAANKVSRKELALRLGNTKGYVSQLLDGTANMTLRTLSDLCVVLGRQFHPLMPKLEDTSSEVMNIGAWTIDLPSGSETVVETNLPSVSSVVMKSTILQTV